MFGLTFDLDVWSPFSVFDLAASVKWGLRRYEVGFELPRTLDPQEWDDALFSIGTTVDDDLNKFTCYRVLGLYYASMPSEEALDDDLEAA